MTAQEIVNNFLDQIREEQGFTSDLQLAVYFGVSDTAIYRWRNGQLGKAAVKLLPEIVSRLTSTELQTAA